MAALQQREATPPTPHARQLPSGAGSVWPFGMVSSFRAGGAGPTAQLDSPPQRLNTLTLQSPLLRSVHSDLPPPSSCSMNQQFPDPAGNARATKVVAVALNIAFMGAIPGLQFMHGSLHCRICCCRMPCKCPKKLHRHHHIPDTSLLTWN